MFTINDENLKVEDLDTAALEMFEKAANFKPTYIDIGGAECVSKNWHKIATLKCDNSDKFTELGVSTAKREEKDGSIKMLIVIDDEFRSYTQVIDFTKEALRAQLDSIISDTYAEWIKRGANKDDAVKDEDMPDGKE